MANTFTSNYNLVKSEIGGDNQNWGSNIHTSLDVLDTQLVNKVDDLHMKGKTIENSADITFADAGSTGTITCSTSNAYFEDFKQNDKILVSGATNSANNGTHTITNKSSNSSVTVSTGTLVAETGGSITISLVLEAKSIDAGATTVDSLTVEGNTTIQGNTTLGNDVSADTTTFTSKVASNVIPSADNSYDLGSSSNEWQNLYIDGTANVDSLVADTVTISAGTISGITSLSVAGTSITITGTSGDYSNFSVGSNGAGKRTVSTSAPGTGADGDIHYEYA